MEKRRIGIPGIGKVAWGEHMCVFFHTRDELVNLVVPYIKAGLEDNEFCLWITGDPLSESEAFQALERDLPDAHQYLTKKQLEILPHSQWYLASGIFNADVVLHNWLSKSKHAQAKGFAGVRITGNPFWLLSKEDWKDFGTYERAVTESIRDERMLALCTYSGEMCRSQHVLQIISSHRSALMARNDHWQHLSLSPP